ncbi:BACON domain-containing carbohydrate-binding protein [uncultured Phocaeicola sp.]|uniref:BACON domain-containing protein n=1 Tax=uncultured Phocaeicola sp. TaxID=990718 RepID=UPI001434497C|nr:BACON domain-containing carbohydrate-binding protein [uncultured Phocaeicola sp.]GFH99341.1 hypothetical protein IMSAGC004_01744 [Bacteroidaceae bacterium]
MKISKYICMAMAGTLICSSTMLMGCKDDSKIPSEFFPNQYLEIVSAHEINISTDATFDIEVNGSSSWKIWSDASWCHFEQPYYGGKAVVTVEADANRGEEERSCYVKVAAFFKDKHVTDSVLVIQPVNKLPALEISPKEDKEIFYKGSTFVLDVVYNYGVDFQINYIAGGEDWITTEPATFIDSEQLVITNIGITVEPNMGDEDREAELVFVNKKDQSHGYSMRITQGHPVPAVTSFFDDFETASTTGKPYEKEGWTFQTNPGGTVLFKQFNNTRKAMLINGDLNANPKAVGYAIWPVFNMKDMQRKAVSYQWGAGNKNPALKGDAFELVASLDYEGDAFAATWTVVQDLTNKAETPGISLPNTLVEIDLSKTEFAHEPRVYLALRYTGGGHAYRFDNLKIGDVKE